MLRWDQHAHLQLFPDDIPLTLTVLGACGEESSYCLGKDPVKVAMPHEQLLLQSGYLAMARCRCG
jgi:hypothetical protein